MTGRSVTVLAVDWRRLRRAYPGVDDRSLAEEAFRRGLRLAVPPSDPSHPTDPPALREAFVDLGARLAVHRFEYVTGRDRFASAARREALTRHEHLRLQREVLPELRARARRLRDEVRALEAALQARGVNPDALGPPVDWEAVPLDEDPSGSDPAAEREAALRLFRRLRPGP